MQSIGVGMVGNEYDISTDQYQSIIEYFDSLSYTQLFTSIDDPKIIAEGAPNRYHNQDSKSIKNFLNECINLDDRLINLITNNDFQHGENHACGEMKYSVIKSDGDLAIPQDPHCDIDQPYSYQTKNSFPFVVVIGIEQYSFMDIEFNQRGIIARILIQRGDVLFIRGDIPHRGCENHASHTHYRLHAYVELKKKNTKRNRKKAVEKQTIKSDSEFPPVPFWNWGDQQWENRLKRNFV